MRHPSPQSRSRTRPTVGHRGRLKVMTLGAGVRAIRIKELQQRVGLSRTSIWRLERRGLFPRRVHLTGNAVGWIDEEIDAWLRARKRREIPPRAHQGELFGDEPRVANLTISEVPNNDR